MGDGLPVDALEGMLDIHPSSVGKKGEHIRGNQNRGRYQTHIWVWAFPAESYVPFEDQIGKLLESLEPKRAVLKQVLSLPDTEGELFLGFASGNGQGGAMFTPGLLRRIADCGLSVTLDLYPPNFDEESKDP
ncbi:DUF4279 domain-containing protein [Methylomonas rivi]|uniref:DUF4279 domain-containing protein n=1 Tax=Methylomonas rivi TaxID=2952226 RepID=UPI00353276D4